VIAFCSVTVHVLSHGVAGIDKTLRAPHCQKSMLFDT
jgi:hypothetical protein